MTDLFPSDIRTLVREVLREAIKELPQATVASLSTSASPAPAKLSSPARVAESTMPRTFANEIGLAPSGPLGAEGRRKVQRVHLTDDSDLASFVSALMSQFENPKTRADVRAGRLTFKLAGGTTGTRFNGGVHRIDKGAVTEKQILRVAEIGGRIVLGPAAVMTPLAREKARALKVPFEKEPK